MISLKDYVVTMDALHCQKDKMVQIVQQQGDFVVQLKANQGKLFQHVQQAFATNYDDHQLPEYVDKEQRSWS